MWKEYRPVADHQTQLDDHAYMDEYWTGVWRRHGDHLSDDRRAVQELAAGLAEWVRKREEYPAVREYASAIPPGGRILDGGSGLGKWVLWWKSLGYDAMGMDISRETVDRLNEFFPGTLFVCGDIRNTGFPDCHFDAYTSWGTFEHFEEGLGRCFQEAARILKPGGLIFVSVPFQNRRFIRKSLRPLARWDLRYDLISGHTTPVRFHQWRLTESELHHEFALHGFEMLSVRPIHQRSGLHWMLGEDFRLVRGTVSHKLAYNVFKPFLPARLVAHMILGVGRKR